MFLLGETSTSRLEIEMTLLEIEMTRNVSPTVVIFTNVRGSLGFTVSKLGVNSGAVGAARLIGASQQKKQKPLNNKHWKIEMGRNNEQAETFF